MILIIVYYRNANYTVLTLLKKLEVNIKSLIRRNLLSNIVIKIIVIILNIMI
jgi:hypothetical protein